MVFCGEQNYYNSFLALLELSLGEWGHFAFFKNFISEEIAGGILKIQLFKAGVVEMEKKMKRKKFSLLYSRSNETKFCSKVLQIIVEKRDVHEF